VTNFSLYRFLKKTDQKEMYDRAWTKVYSIEMMKLNDKSRMVHTREEDGRSCCDDDEK
jgi:hypothetical protein